MTDITLYDKCYVRTENGVQGPVVWDEFYERFRFGTSYWSVDGYPRGFGSQVTAVYASLEEAAGMVKVDDVPDMFWDALDPEIPYEWAHEVCDSYGHGVVCEIQRAIRLGNSFVATLPAADDSETDDNWEVECNSKQECLDAVNAEMNRRAALPSPPITAKEGE